VAMKRRVLVVGLGSMGRRHLRLLRERNDVDVSSVEPDQNALALARSQAGEFTNYGSLEEALTQAPDVVWLATPTPLHASQTIAALNAGCNVFCEKPMSESVGDARAMKAAAEQTRKLLNIGFHLHFWEGAIRMRRYIEAGRLGRVVHAHAKVGSYVTLVNSLSRYQAANPGSLFLDYSHQPDLFLWFLKAVPHSVFVAGFEAKDLELRSAPNVADILCRYDAPLVTSIHLNYVQMPERHEYEITGELAWIRADLNLGTLAFGERESQTVQVEEFKQDKDTMIRAEQHAYFEALDGRVQPSTSAHAGLISTAICSAAIDSWRSGTAVQLDLTKEERQWTSHAAA
jgi:predicted dehydrogenase